MSDLERLADRVRAARLALEGAPTQGEMAARAGVSVMTWGSVERGESVGDRSQIKIAAALGWTPDSIDRILRGEEPQQVSVSDPLSARLDAIEARLDRLTAQLAAVEEAVKRG